MQKNLVARSLEGPCSEIIEDIEADAWHQRERSLGESEWTLHQTVAHLAAVAEFYRSALQFALRHETLLTPGFQQRQDLPALNRRHIQERQHLHRSTLIAALQQALVDTVEIAQP